MFKELVEIINKNPHHLDFTEEMIEEIFKAGVLHGLFPEENYGFYDRQNTVWNLISTLATLNGKTFI